jgi:RNA polymerase sigma-70 factor (ECF subfamily)
MDTPPTDLADRMVEALPSLQRFARVLARDPAVADDLVQETVARALERSEQFRGDSSVRTWLHRILYHLSVDRARKEARSTPVDGAEVVARVEERWMDDAYTVDAAVVAERAETRAEIEDALVRVPYIYRSAVLLHDVEGLTMREVADMTDTELPAAKQRLRRGRMMLVSALAGGAERRAEIGDVPLRCWDARRLVSDYLDDELAPDERRAVELHLEGCPTCPPLYSALVGTHAGLGRLRDPDSVIRPDLAERIRAAATSNTVHPEAGSGA